MKKILIFNLLAIMLLLSACNKNTITSIKRGQLLSSKFITTISKDDINSYFPESKVMQGDITNIPKYDIDLYKITYGSIYKNSLVKLSGLVLVPKKEGKYTHLQYHHGTLIPYRTKDGSGSLGTPSFYKGTNPQYNKYYETRLYGNYLASYGYLVSIPDYSGYGVSSDLEHPYSVNPQLAKESVDMILATQEFSKNKHLSLNKKMYLVGWSEGAAASVATQRLIEKKYINQIKVWANASISGLLNIKGNKNLFLSLPLLPIDLKENINFLLWSFYSYNKFGSNPLASDKLFKIPVYDEVDIFFNEHSSISSEVFKVLDEDARKYMIKQIEKNDLLDWSPISPLFVYHGTDDETVPYKNNAEVAVKYYNAQGGNAILKKYENYGHTSLLLVQIQDMIVEFEKIEKNNNQ